MLFLQIKQAEVAMADGRLDEAYQLVQTDGLRTHRRGQALVTALVERLTVRAKSHMEAGRYSQALVDCEKAQFLGGNLSDIVALRAQVETEMVTVDRARRAQAAAGMVQTAAQRVDSALGRKDLDAAVAELVRARGNGVTDPRLRSADATVRSTLQAQVQTALAEGRLDQLTPLMDRLERLDPGSMATEQYRRAIEQARVAWAAITRGDVSAALETLRRMQMQLPAAKWVNQVVEHLDAAEESLRAVRTSPLGLLAVDEPVRHAPSPRAPAAATHDPLPPPASEPLPMKFLIQVDGAGSYLVFRQPRVTLGPISSSRNPDVGLIAEPSAPILAVERVEDDYFLRGEAIPGMLLSTGDRIALSPRCRLQFTLPNPSSTTAVLDLTAGRFPRADLHRVILLDDSLVIGAGSNAHIRAPHLTEPIVLHVRDGELRCRTQAIVMGATTNLSGISLVVTNC